MWASRALSRSRTGSGQFGLVWFDFGVWCVLAASLFSAGWEAGGCTYFRCVPPPTHTHALPSHPPPPPSSPHYTHPNHSYVYTANEFMSEELPTTGAAITLGADDDDDDDTSVLGAKTTANATSSFYDTSKEFIPLSDDDGVPDYEVRGLVVAVGLALSVVSGAKRRSGAVGNSKPMAHQRPSFLIETRPSAIHVYTPNGSSSSRA